MAIRYSNPFLLFFISAFLIGCGEQKQYRDYPVAGLHRAEVMGDLGLADPVDPMDAATKAREFLYQTNTPVYYTTVPSDAIDDQDREYRMYVGIKDGSRIYVCDGLSRVFVWMMKEIGIDARAVMIGNEAAFGGTGQKASHVMAEVWINNRWIVFDALFNTTYHINGGPEISAAQIIENADNVTWRYGSAFDNPQRTIEYYYGSNFSSLLFSWDIYY